MDIDLCPVCGNKHSGSCTTELIYFVWYPEPGREVEEVQLIGSWHKWQNKEKMSRQINEKGQTYFELGLTLPVGVYEYKYLVDGQWTVDQSAPISQNEYQSHNNYIQVFPKKTFIEMIPKNDIKITSNINLDGLKIIGSWDDWKEQIPMQRTYNSLKGCEENVVYLRLVPGASYQFKFKIGKQYLIDQKYPTVVNEFGTQNNRIITYSERIETPTGWRSKQSYSSQKHISCRCFQWQRMATDSQLSYEKVQGHSLVTIGENIYIFGGKTRGQFVNTLVKTNIHQFSNANVEQVLPNGRAFHSAATYGNKMIIFGGINKTILEDYYSFNTAQGTWSAPPTITGKFPAKKQKQSCVLYDMMLVFFGGYNCTPDFEYETYYNEITALNIEKMQWIKEIKTEGKLPKGRFSHSACLIGSEMYIFGGLTSSLTGQENVPTKAVHLTQQKNLNDIWKINLQEVNRLVWSQLTPKGKLPQARHGHTMNVISNFIIIFAGRNDRHQFLSDICVFDTEKNQWIYPLVHGEVPRPRYNHAATVIHNDYLVVFGGKVQEQKANKYFYLLKPKQFQTSLDIEEEDDIQQTLPCTSQTSNSIEKRQVIDFAQGSTQQKSNQMDKKSSINKQQGVQNELKLRMNRNSSSSDGQEPKSSQLANKRGSIGK